MPTFLGSLFNCNNTRNNGEDITELKERVTRLEIQFSGLKDILMEIKMDIKLLHLELKQEKKN